jgi:hypothetical protein
MPFAGAQAALSLANVALAGDRALELRYDGLAADPVAALTPTFTPPNVTRMRTYELMATPLVYPGQWMSARVIAAKSNLDEVHASLRILVYGREDHLDPIDGANSRARLPRLRRRQRNAVLPRPDWMGCPPVSGSRQRRTASPPE